MGTTGQAKEQSSCSEWTGIPRRSEHGCENWEPLRRAFGPSPAGSFAWVGLRWCGGSRRANLVRVPWPGQNPSLTLLGARSRRPSANRQSGRCPLVLLQAYLPKRGLVPSTHKSLLCSRIGRERRSRPSWPQPAGNNILCAASSPGSFARSSVSTWCQNQAKAVASIASSMARLHQPRLTE